LVKINLLLLPFLDLASSLQFFLSRFFKFLKLGLLRESIGLSKILLLAYSLGFLP
jgi:hypothetical protein